MCKYYHVASEYVKAQAHELTSSTCMTTDSLDDAMDTLELAEEPSPTPATTQSSNTGLELPDWFKAGEYSLQPGSRKYPLILDEKDLAEKFIRGSGPGGQAINKLSTNVQLTHLPTGTKVTCQETRSRDRNRKLARRRMSLTLEKLVRGEGGGSRIDRQIEKERRKKLNKKKKQKKRLREKEQLADTELSSESSVSQDSI